MGVKQSENGVVYREKMVDYKHYGFTLLCLSVFLYIGTFISMSEGTIHPGVIVALTLLLLSGSALFFTLSIRYKKKTMKTDE
ncbi:YrhC family protein [Bacillus sp. JJ722]|uniref:YrhC family protein n=1 Tax=Bacillus sp. JJ722 TaxID=3122973 RepID=UPI002FFFDEB9